MTTLVNAKPTGDAHKKPWLTRRLAIGLSPAALILAGIMLFSLGLHLFNLQAIRDANHYYTAAAESMLDSWHNFFFVSAEPGGSVTVDKPPLGLWIEAAFTYVLGVSGFSVVLPNILAGLASTVLLYHLVKRYFGAGPGLAAAAVMAVTPVALAANRNNTMDSLLTFTLLLGAWAFILAAEKGSLKHLLLGAFLVGLGFNIKMLQAFLPLPAFYALYFFASKQGWLRKLLYLLLAVSLAWAVAVDLVPADERPYIGSSQDNTVMELIFGHNGLNRLFGGRGNPTTFLRKLFGFDDRPQPVPGAIGNANPPAGALPPTQRLAFGQDGPQPFAPPPYGFQQPGQPPGANPRMNEVGEQGWLRFFETPLVDPAHKGFILWGGWLLTCLVFFSVASFFHAYYMVMLVLALGAALGMGIYVILQWYPNHPWRALLVLLASSALTLLFQVYLVAEFDMAGIWLVIPLTLLAVGVAFLAANYLGWLALNPSRIFGIGFVLLALLFVPAVWSYLTVAVDSPNVNLPAAYGGVNDQRNLPQAGSREPTNDALLDFLQANTQGSKYLLAVPSAQIGAPFVLATELPVLYIGGFTGSDPVVDANDLAEMVAVGELRFVLYGMGNQNHAADINRWLQQECTLVPQFSRAAAQDARLPNPGGGPGGGEQLLYDCMR